MNGSLEILGQDLKYALRGLRRSPVFTLVAVLTLTIGIGATTTVFSIINGVLLRPLPYPDQDRLVALSNVYPNLQGSPEPVSGTDVSHWRDEDEVFEKLEFVSRPDVVAMSSAGSGERVAVQHMSAQLLPLLGIKSFLGTLPSDETSEKNGSLGVLISYEFWKRHFGGDPHVLGQNIFVDTWSPTIIAVLEPGFDLFGTGSPEIYEIDGMGDSAESGINDPRWLLSVGKLKEGISLQRAQAAMNVKAFHLAQLFPDAYKGMGVKVEPLQTRLFGSWVQMYSTLFGIVVLVLLIACANVANLLLVRADARRNEIGVRVALGANHLSLIRQLLTESVLLSLIGGATGLSFSFLGVRIFNFWAPLGFPRASGIWVDGRVLFFTLGTCVLTGVGFGMIPAYRAVRTNVNDSLRESARSTARVSRHRARNVIVITEIALAMVLLSCAGLMINTLRNVLRTAPGFNPEHLLTAEVRLTGNKYIDGSQVDTAGLQTMRPAVGQFCQQVLDRVRNIPGVEGVALVDWLPLLENHQYATPHVDIAGRSMSPGTQKPAVIRESTSSDYFRLMTIPVLRGRAITEQDTESNAWVVVINDAMARQLWPNEDPIGQVIRFDDSPDEKPRQIVGVVGNVKQFRLTLSARPEAYVAYQQMPARIVAGFAEARIHKSLIIRTYSGSNSMMQTVRRTILRLAPESAVFGISPVKETVSNSASSWRFLSQVLELFAAMALVLAVIGIYGVISYSVGERSHELGLRMALGAQPGQVLALVLQRGVVLSLTGVVIGLAGSFAATPLLGKFLFGVKAHDVPTLFAVSLFLIAVTFAASYVPGRHATKIDPMRTLRHE
jgi:putative ABC transport system permease protein